MAEKEQLVMKLISDGYSSNEIIGMLNITPKELWLILKSLKDKGIDFKRNYHYDGNLYYSLDDDTESHSVMINMPDGATKFVALAMSDLHLGRNLQSPIRRIGERLDLLKRCFDYCAKKGIHTIINGGDFLESVRGAADFDINYYEEQKKQLDYAIENYPYERGMVTYLVLGNHDFDAFNLYGVNVKDELEARRHDIAVMGYGYGRVKIEKDNFLVIHKLRNDADNAYLRNYYSFSLKGHSHKMKYFYGGSNPDIYIPALLDQEEECDPFKSVLKITITLEKGMFHRLVVEQLLVESNFLKISESVNYLVRKKR